MKKYVYKSLGIFLGFSYEFYEIFKNIFFTDTSE